MSLFSAFGQKGLAVFAQTIENIGNIVAPVPEEDGIRDEDNISDNEEESFENKLHSFINFRRDEIVAPKVSDEPQSPGGSMVDVDLGSDSEDRTRNTSSNYANYPLSHVDNVKVHTTAFLSNDELEKKVQQKYRESLEGEVSTFDTKYRDLEYVWEQKLSSCQSENDVWRKKAGDLERECQLLRSQAQSKHNENNDKDNQFVNLQNNFNTLTQSHNLLLSRSKETDSSLLNSAQELEVSRQLATHLQQSSQQAVQDSNREHVAKYESLQRSYTLVVAELEDLKQRCAELSHETSIQSVSHDVAHISLLVSEVDELKKCVSDRDSRLALVDVELLAARLRSEEVSAAHQQLLQNHEDLVAALRVSEDQVRSLTGQLGELEQQCAALQAVCSATSAAQASDAGRAELVAGLQSAVDSLTGDLSQALTEKAQLARDLQIAVEQSENALAQANVQSQKLLSEREHLQQAVTAWQVEVQRLNEVLLQSEDALKVAEDTAWQAKAETSEMLFALQLEEDKVRRLTESEVALRREIADIKTAVEQQQMSTSSPELTTPEITTALSVGSVGSVESSETGSKLQAISRLDLLGVAEQQSSALRLLQSIICTYSTEPTEPLHGVELMVSPISNVDQETTVDQLLEVLQRGAACTLDVLQALSVSMKAAFHNHDAIRSTLSEIAAEMASFSALTVDTPSASSTVALSKAISSSVSALLAAHRAALGNVARANKQSEQQEQSRNEECARLSAQLLEARECAAASAVAAEAALQQERCALQAEIARLTQQAEALSIQLQSCSAQYERHLQGAVDAKRLAEQELAILQNNSADSTAQTSAARREVQKLETETRQLHQVIAQLRQVRKSHKGEEENLVGERDELRALTSSQQTEIAKLEKAVAVNASSAEQVTRLRSELAASLNKAAYLEQSLDEARRQLSALESGFYSKESQLDVATSDMLLLRQDLDQRSAEVANLMQALTQIQAEKTEEIGRCRRELAEKLDEFRLECDDRVARIIREWGDKLAAEEQRRAQAEQEREDQRLFRRKAELEFNQEKKRVQSTLESALQQLNNSQQDVVDRTLISNLLVSYFRKRRSLEVMELIAKVLAFGDEQKVAVGLKVAPTNVISSLFASVMGSAGPVPEPEGDNLAEQWINFLITQAEENNSNAGKPALTPTTSPRNANK